GPTTVSAGTLSVDGSLGTGDVTVASGATLAGNGGTIGGNVTIASGGILAHTMGATETFNQNLTVAAGGLVNIALGSDDLPLFHVKGNLDASGTLTVTDDGGFGAGDYTVFKVDGTVTNNMTLAAGNNVTLGDISFVNDAHSISIQNGDGMKLVYWDGTNTTGDGTIHGGQGNWGGTTTNWTGKDGNGNGQWATGDFAVLKGTAGAVTVDAGGISTGGIQFVSDGYKVSGGTITLLNDTKAPIIRVGDGTQAGAGATATISAVLDGTHGLKKTDYGTLVLTGANTYTGQTDVAAGKLQLGDGSSQAGTIAGDVSVQTGGTLEFQHDNSAEYVFAHVIDGTGQVVVSGKGGTGASHAVTHLNGANSFSGGLEVEANAEARAGSATAFGSGVVTVDAGGLASLNGQDVTAGGLQGAGSVDVNNNKFTLNQTDDTEFSGTLVQSGGANGTLVKNGTGMLTLTGNDNTALVTVSGGTLRIGADDGVGSNAGTSGDVKNNIAIDANGTLAFNRSDSYTYGHTLSGAGAVEQTGRGTTILTQNNTNSGTTTISRGTLQLGDGTSGAGTVGGAVVNNATLAFNHSGSFAFDHAISGSGLVVADGTGPTTLSGQNSFTGGVEVKSGATLRAGIADVAFGSGLLTVDQGGKADITGFNTKLSGLAGAGHVELGAQTLTLTGQGDNFSGSLTGTGGLTLDNVQQTFSGQNNTYSGETTLKNNALLSAGADNSLSAASAYVI
ncbi:beta strand repeat-containing protein, partial [Brucella anthropi]|uniref:beta strand repeat-containing protein n=1 Tax=Brucella anthropi TaxID=529 RepID=UPI00235F4911